MTSKYPPGHQAWKKNLFLVFNKKCELTRSGPIGSSPDHEHFMARVKTRMISETVLPGTFAIGLQ
jgi:hypothetical protein